MKVKIEIDGVVKFTHSNWEKIDYSIMMPVESDEDGEEIKSA